MISDLIVDSFAGGGGASLGIEMALGRSPDIAVNHDPEAIAMHQANHPDTRHYLQDVWEVDPREACGGKPVALAWFSPTCTHFSKAKGGKPLNKKIRSLAWVVCRWAKLVRPRVICLENVEEFADWGPLLDDGRPCPVRRGLTFKRWMAQIRNLGYQVETRELVAADYGAPTSRKRLFVIARCDGQPIVWPRPTHGGWGVPCRTAAECIEWSLPVPSIFERTRPLAENTMRRIARGIYRYVLRTADPFIVGIDNASNTSSVWPSGRPLSTITAEARHAIVSPTLVQTGYGEREGQAPRSLDLHAPFGTVVAGGVKHALVAAFLAKHYGGHEATGSRLHDPVDTVTAIDHHALVRTDLRLWSEERPMHRDEVRAFLLAYYSVDQNPQLRLPMPTVTTHDRFGLVTVAGEEYELTDIGMRMLAPRELFRAQGFPDSYTIEVECNGRPLSKASQVRCCGNSVAPPVAAAIIRANVGADSVGAVA